MRFLRFFPERQRFNVQMTKIPRMFGFSDILVLQLVFLGYRSAFESGRWSEGCLCDVGWAPVPVGAARSQTRLTGSELSTRKTLRGVLFRRGTDAVRWTRGCRLCCCLRGSKRRWRQPSKVLSWVGFGVGVLLRELNPELLASMNSCRSKTARPKRRSHMQLRLWCRTLLHAAYKYPLTWFMARLRRASMQGLQRCRGAKLFMKNRKVRNRFFVFFTPGGSAVSPFAALCVWTFNKAGLRVPVWPSVKRAAGRLGRRSMPPCAHTCTAADSRSPRHVRPCECPDDAVCQWNMTVIKPSKHFRRLSSLHRRTHTCPWDNQQW